MMRIKVKIAGADELVKTIKTLEQKAAKRVLRKVLRAGASVIMRKARSLAPKDTGTLRKSLGVRIHVKRGRPVVIAIIGPRTKFVKMFGNRRRWASKYAHLTEFGRKGFSYRRKGQSVDRRVGPVLGTRWLERAATTSSEAALAKMTAKAAQEMLKEAARA